MRGRLQPEADGPNRSNEVPTHHDFLSHRTAPELGVFSKNERGTLNVALHMPVEMDVAVRRYIASD
jgi:hypothetical protein